MKTQEQIVKEHLNRHGSITSIHAISEYGITRLSDKIYKLRGEGMNIETERMKGLTRQGNITSYAKYRIA